ncbi:MAG TPA: F0F1 ATP synthase subunit B [Longimicrobiales bacterium]|nr:F0F1 ATP synthase subunit B [Longimicrobiales bacterium]
MNLIFLALQAAEHAPEAAHQPSIFGMNPGVSFYTFVIFLVLSVVLAKYAFPPILGYAAAREQRIQDALDESKRQREEAAQLLEQQRAELAAARAEVQTIIAGGKLAGERVREDMLARAKADQDEMVTRAKQEIERERQLAVESLRREAVDLALAAAAKLVGHRVDAAEDRKLVTDYLSSVGTGPAGMA